MTHPLVCPDRPWVVGNPVTVTCVTTLEKTYDPQECGVAGVGPEFLTLDVDVVEDGVDNKHYNDER